MRRTAASLHIFLTLLLLAGLLFGAVGQTLVQALGGNLAPTSVTFNLRTPATSPTNADTLTFRVTFNDAVTAVDASDFTMIPPINGSDLTVTSISQTIYDVKIFGGNLDFYNGDVTLGFSAGAQIKDAAGIDIDLTGIYIAQQQTYVVDNNNPFIAKGDFLALGLSEPATTQPISYTLAFSEPINPASFTPDDITQAGTASHPVWTIADTGDHKNFDLTVTASGNGTIIPIITAGRVQDPAGNGNDPFILPCSDPPDDLDHCVTLKDTTGPTVTIEQSPTQPDPDTELPVFFTITFSEEIIPATFETQDIVMAPSPLAANVSDWHIFDSGDHKTFELKVWATSNGIIVPTIPAGGISDLIGNGNIGFTKDTCDNAPPDNCVTLQDDVRPTVTIEQYSDQVDPTDKLPIRFTVTFSEPIKSGDFTPEDINQTGTALKLKWEVRATGNSGQVFSIYATQATRGTVIPVIPQGSVRDRVGNYNRNSTSVDNSVTYDPGAPTPTPVQGPLKTVVISEVAWMGTSALTPSDEWIELYNTTNDFINLDGWHLVSYRWTGTTTNGRWDINLNIAFGPNDIIQPRNSADPENTSGYYLLERDDDDTVKGIEADKIYSPSQLKYGTLSDSGEIILLCTKQNWNTGDCIVNLKNRLVDYVNASLSSTGQNNPWPAGKGSPLYGSMERKHLNSDENTAWFTHPANNPRYGHDRNWNGKTITANRINGTPKHENWAFDVTATPLPTPTFTRTPTRVPNTTTALLVLNEVLARSGSDWNNDGKVDVYDEFIEVVNSGVVNVVLSNYKLDDGLNVGSAPFSLPNQTLKPGEIAVFYGSQTGIRLEDSGDTVRLLRASNNSALDSVTYPIAKSVDTSVCRYTDAYGSWLTNCFPTPGRPNALSGELRPSTSGGSLIPVCFLPDSVPDEFVLAECGIESGGIWNHNYWDTFPGEGSQLWQIDPDDKWLVIYQ